MKYYLGVPEELIQKGVLELYEDDSEELVPAVKSYNDNERACRVKYIEVEQTIKSFYIMSPVFVVILTFLGTDVFSGSKKLLSIAFLVIWLLSYLWFALKKRNILFCTVFTLPLLYISLLFFVVIAFEGILTYRYEKLDRPMRDDPTYPVFVTIDIKYRRGKRSQLHDAGERL